MKTGIKINEVINFLRDSLFSIIFLEPSSTKYCINDFIIKNKISAPIIAIPIVRAIGNPRALQINPVSPTAKKGAMSKYPKKPI